MEKAITACGKCGKAVDQSMRFCPICGKRICEQRSSRWYGAVVAAGLSLFLVGIGLQTLVQGGLKPPAKQPESQPGPAHHAEQDTDDPQILAMRKELEQAPEDLGKLRIFAGMLGDKLRSNPTAPPALVFEAIDVFGRILQREPNDPMALVMMADVSFDQRAFTKALDFYERYLKLEGDDLGARARYASTLTFLGRYDQSIAELNTVLTSDPKNFPATAYLSITYAQQGNVPKAKELGATALSLAPSDEARARFSAFVSSLDGAQSELPDQRSRQSGGAQVNGASAATSKGGVAGFIASIQQNPIAGPKFVGHTQDSPTVLRLVFRSFPMNQMPPFAKEKFFNSLRMAAKNNDLAGIKKLIFVDQQTQSEMESLSLLEQ